MSNNRPQDVADILEGMDTPTPNEVYEATREYDTNYIASAAASKAHAGGGSLPDPFVVTGTDPNATTALISGAPSQDGTVLSVETESGGDELLHLATSADGRSASISGDGASLTLTNAGTAQLSGVALMLKVPLAEPADGLLNQQGQVLFWLINTPSAVKLHFKCLDADDTVAKGEISLT